MVLAILVALAALHWLASRGVGERIVARLPYWAYAAGYGAIIPVALALTPSGLEPFIYFQF